MQAINSPSRISKICDSMQEVTRSNQELGPTFKSGTTYYKKQSVEVRRGSSELSKHARLCSATRGAYRLDSVSKMRQWTNERGGIIHLKGTFCTSSQGSPWVAKTKSLPQKIARKVTAKFWWVASGVPRCHPKQLPTFAFGFQSLGQSAPFIRTQAPRSGRIRLTIIAADRAQTTLQLQWKH